MAPSLSEHRFLAIRSLLVELAASLDRVERHAAEEATTLDADRRWRLLTAAVERLGGAGGRAEALQELFSDPYDPDWRRDGGPTLAGSRGCCGD